MKKIVIQTILLLCVLVAGSSSAWATTYKLEKTTSVEAGSLYVFEQEGHVMKNTISSNALQTTTSYAITGLSGLETYVWCLESATGGFYMKNVSKASKEYLNNTTSTTLAFGDKSTIWTFTFEDEVALIKTSDGEHFLGYPDISITPRSYVYRAMAIGNISISPHDITVYKLVDEDSQETPDLTDPALSAISSFINMDTTTELDANGLYTVTSDGAISFSSTDETVAKVEGEKLKALKPGTATITISVAQTDTYASGSVNIEITVASKPAVAPVGADAGTGYHLVTDISTLVDGGNILFVGSKENGTAKAMSTDQKQYNRGVIDVTLTNGIVETISDDAQVVTLEKSSNYWYFNVGTGYLYAASSSSNYLKTETEKDNNAKAAISIDGDAKANVVFQGTNTHKVLRFNSTNGLFSCYESAESVDDFYIFKYETSPTFDIEIDEFGWKSIVSAHDIASLPTGLKAYIVTGENATTATLTEVNRIVKNTPILLRGAQGTYTLTIATSPIADYDVTNLLQISTETTGNGVFVLAKIDDKVGFYKWTGGSLGAGRVYLDAPSTAHEFLGLTLGDETGVNEVRGRREEGRGEVYDLQGRKVLKPTQGLYIVNGKRVAVK